MSKPKVYGSFRSFLPNNRADSRRRKVWEHNRRVAERDEQFSREEKAEKEKFSKAVRQKERLRRMEEALYAQGET